jgi:uncharacterized protein YbgA (DUF1722 family)/uncharacterized protein YbbK (DUF523 family)
MYFSWVPVCPEVEYGLPVPREAMRLVGDAGSPRLVGVRSGTDHTEGMLGWAQGKLLELERKDLCGFVFKSKSPSSGMSGVKVYASSGMPVRRGKGIFGGAFTERFPLVPAIDDGRLHNPTLRENFIERVFVFRRWKEFLKAGGSLGALVDFHTRHKLLILSHSPAHHSALGRLVAGAKRRDREGLMAEYAFSLMEGLSLMATARKNTNVLQHIAGYFRKNLSPDEKQELGELIEDYHRGLVPLVVPLALIRHYVRKFGVTYLKDQHYLNPHPAELMLRNHV